MGICLLYCTVFAFLLGSGAALQAVHMIFKAVFFHSILYLLRMYVDDKTKILGSELNDNAYQQFKEYV